MATETAYIDIEGEAFPDAAEVIRYRAVETISVPFEVNVEFSIPMDVEYAPAESLRKSAAIALTNEAGARRYFHGLVDQVAYLAFTGTDHHFTARLRPSIAALEHRENCRIWQNTNVVDVVKELFSDAGVDNVEWLLHHAHDSREYIVQYRESELNFVHRLFEDEGLMYWYRHTTDGHTIVIADDVKSFKPADDAPEVEFGLAQGYGAVALRDFVRRRAARCNQVHLRDFDFEKPEVKPEAVQPSDGVLPMHFFEYPAGFVQTARGSLMAKARLRARRRDADVAQGTSRAIGLRCGVPFSVAGAEQAWIDGDYVVVTLETWGEQTLESGGDNEVAQNAFEAIPAETEWLPARRAWRPRIRGMQTAVTTGPSADAQAIHVDKYGRVKVRFFWDRLGPQDDTSSCWLRVVQTANSGTVLLPRVGWEMAIGFLEGNPDRPFAYGRYYNGEKVAPAGLPGAKASGGLKSYSSPGGAGINELNLGDAGGSMGWTMNAQKDLNVVIEHDKTETIAVDSAHDIKTNVSVSVGNDEKTTIKGNQTEEVGSSRVQVVTGDQSIDIAGNFTDNATSNYLETVGGDRTYTIGGNMTRISNTIMQTVTGNISRSVGTLQLTASIASITDTVGGDYSEDVGLIKAELTKGATNEAVGGSKNQTSVLAEFHMISGNLDQEGEGTITYLVGGVHYQKIGGNLEVKGSMVTLLGATGDFKGGDSNLKLGGGPVVAKGSAIAAKAKGILVKFGSSLKQG